MFVLTGLLLIWVGFTLYMIHQKKKNLRNGNLQRELRGKTDKEETASPDNTPNSGATPQPKPLYKGTESSGGLMICPLCLFRMDNSEMIKTRAFPPMPGEKDRLMHIHGCVYCLDGKRERLCPVCGKTLSVSDFLVARIFDRSMRRSHVHVLGCTQCRPLKTM
jgi:hypothetical protein